MAEANILMQEKQDDGAYNQLYPITKASNVNYTNSALSGVSNTQQGLDSIVNTLDNINLNNYFTKTQTLTSSTAALFGLDTNAVPDDVLAYLGKYAQHWWAKIKKGYKISIGYTQPRFNQSIETGYSNTSEVTVEYGDSVIIDTNGNVTIESPLTVTFSYSTYQNFDVTKGKYFIYPEDGKVYKNTSSTGVTRERISSKYYIIIEQIDRVNVVPNYEVLSYVQSFNKNDYPEFGEKDGYVYQYIGKPFDNAATSIKCTVGNYVGTGTSGSDNPVQLSFEFIPKVVIIRSNDASFDYGAIFVNGQEIGITDGRGSNIASSEDLNIEWNGNTVKFNNDSSNDSESMLNSEGIYYFYIAFG